MFLPCDLVKLFSTLWSCCTLSTLPEKSTGRLFSAASVQLVCVEGEGSYDLSQHGFQHFYFVIPHPEPQNVEETHGFSGLDREQPNHDHLAGVFTASARSSRSVPDDSGIHRGGSGQLHDGRAAGDCVAGSDANG